MLFIVSVTDTRQWLVYSTNAGLSSPYNSQAPATRWEPITLQAISKSRDWKAALDSLF